MSMKLSNYLVFVGLFHLLGGRNSNLLILYRGELIYLLTSMDILVPLIVQKSGKLTS